MRRIERQLAAEPADNSLRNCWHEAGLIGVVAAIVYFLFGVIFERPNWEAYLAGVSGLILTLGVGIMLNIIHFKGSQLMRLRLTFGVPLVVLFLFSAFIMAMTRPPEVISFFQKHIYDFWK